MTTYHRADVGGHRLFYREAGSKDSSTIVLLHGFPRSSHMFRDLIPQLFDKFYVVAPDYLGFGYSDAPSAQEFEYTLFQYTYGVADPERISPDSYTVDQYCLDRPGNAAIQLDLLYNYQSNLALYDRWHEYFRNRTENADSLGKERSLLHGRRSQGLPKRSPERAAAPD